MGKLSALAAIAKKLGIKKTKNLSKKKYQQLIFDETVPRSESFAGVLDRRAERILPLDPRRRPLYRFPDDATFGLPIERAPRVPFKPGDYADFPTYPRTGPAPKNWEPKRGWARPTPEQWKANQDAWLNRNRDVVPSVTIDDLHAMGPARKGLDDIGDPPPSVFGQRSIPPEFSDLTPSVSWLKAREGPRLLSERAKKRKLEDAAYFLKKDGGRRAAPAGPVRTKWAKEGFAQDIEQTRIAALAKALGIDTVEFNRLLVKYNGNELLAANAAKQLTGNPMSVGELQSVIKASTDWASDQHRIADQFSLGQRQTGINQTTDALDRAARADAQRLDSALQMTDSERGALDRAREIMSRPSLRAGQIFPDEPIASVDPKIVGLHTSLPRGWNSSIDRGEYIPFAERSPLTQRARQAADDNPFGRDPRTIDTERAYDARKAYEDWPGGHVPLTTKAKEAKGGGAGGGGKPPKGGDDVPAPDPSDGPLSGAAKKRSRLGTAAKVGAGAGALGGLAYLASRYMPEDEEPVEAAGVPDIPSRDEGGSTDVMSMYEELLALEDEQYDTAAAQAEARAAEQKAQAMNLNRQSLQYLAELAKAEQVANAQWAIEQDRMRQDLDRAGQELVAGPQDFYIDPSSDAAEELGRDALDRAADERAAYEADYNYGQSLLDNDFYGTARAVESGLLQPRMETIDANLQDQLNQLDLARLESTAGSKKSILEAALKDSDSGVSGTAKSIIVPEKDRQKYIDGLFRDSEGMLKEVMPVDPTIPIEAVVDKFFKTGDSRLLYTYIRFPLSEEGAGGL